MFMSLPQPNDGFVWTQAPWGPVVQCRPLLAVAHHFFTAASVVLREDEREWEAVAAFAGVPRLRLRLLHQVHGKAIAVARGGDEEGWGPPRADGVISDDQEAALTVRV